MLPEHPYWQEVLQDARPLLVLYPGPHAVSLHAAQQRLSEHGVLVAALAETTAGVELRRCFCAGQVCQPGNEAYRLLVFDTR